MSLNDPYGLFHLELNEVSDLRRSKPSRSCPVDPTTEWLNMGYWKKENAAQKTFPQACEALALKLIDIGSCRVDGNVLDVGHGTGESLLLQLSHPAVPPPSRLTGITSLKVHYERSLCRVRRLQDSLPNTKTEVCLYHGDAIYRPGAVNHPLDPDSTGPLYTTILALDCAYHFQTRNDFLSQAFRCLASGGHVALADICFTPPSLQSWSSQCLFFILRLVPKQNIISTEQYVRAMTSIGYVDVELEDITDDVFPGFTGFLSTRGLRWFLLALVLRCYAYAGARFVLVSGTKS
ncbi:hypothetical protein SERLA73DRAFT_76937 [Serpula lacrymans var. lacrymans S7.3]|uniref:S-adenosyl-L-methionine-dependent methyltransferase n=2 Tax=Serpula lacrymans var. lacrymans TaxID=341189 RepID=F8Q8J9_SERL3|nr:uncharacterized protein SERLADRAFT_441756 [Serpula lacrymans var. lacrymans S7.9]EGN95887.1 hypothetical protein SERLA73DRAFT_76937 [Serpula lacrymans var. lacrymans S7.3]EGO21401.1 hypothetical protein SERLADRAFT_441756 [Serpula lacrymans var. lacrymans S7.9]